MATVRSSNAFCDPPQVGNVSQDAKCRLQSFGQTVDLGVGDTLELSGACLLVSGSAKQWWTLPNGMDHITAFSYAGSLIFGRPAMYSSLRLTALERSVAILVPLAAFQTIMDEDRTWGDDILNAATAQISSLQVHATMLARMSACERVAAFLASLADTGPRDASNPLHLQLPMSRAEIGDHLALTIETVSRCFTRLKNSKLIECPTRHEVLVLDAAGLASYHEPT